MDTDLLYRVTREDEAKLIALLTECFTNDPLYQELIPDEEKREKLLPELFRCGGQLGIEALSRGAARCVFLDASREAVRIVMDNCKACGVFDRSRVNLGEAARYLSACREQFDLALLDPPFRQGMLEQILPAVDKVMAPGGIVLCESEVGLVLPAQVGGLTLQKQYKYGKVLLWKYLKPRQEEQRGEEE